MTSTSERCSVQVLARGRRHKTMQKKTSVCVSRGMIAEVAILYVHTVCTLDGRELACVTVAVLTIFSHSQLEGL